MPKSLKRSSVKFGNVLVGTHDKAEFLQLKSAKFSNGDLKVYDESRLQLHSQYENMKGATIRLGFQLEYPDLLQGKAVKINGKLKLPLKLGEYPEPDLDNLEKAVEEEKRYFKDLYLLPEDKADKVVETSRTSVMFLLCSPGRPIMEQTLLLKTGPLVIIDDILETLEKENGDEKGGLEVSHKLLSELAKFLHDFVMAEENEMSGVSCAMKLMEIASKEKSLSNLKNMDMFKLGCALCDYFIDFKEEVVDVGKKHKLIPEGIMKIFSQALEAAVLELSKEWKQLEIASMTPIRVKVRQEAVGGVFLCETIAFQNGIWLSERIRENVIFRSLIDYLGKISQKVNDILSYNKEIEGKEGAGSCNNEVYLLHACKKLPIRIVIENLLWEANESIEQIEKLSYLLLQLFPNGDEEHYRLQAYLKIAKEMIVGIILWHGFVKRYHKDLVFDCYISMFHLTRCHSTLDVSK